MWRHATLLRDTENDTENIARDQAHRNFLTRARKSLRISRAHSQGNMPQRKITEPLAETADDLPDLTAQQMEFVRAILAGKTGVDAYRHAYDARDMLPSTAIAAASRLRAQANISAWLTAARHAHLGTAVLTREQHMQELESIREGCKASGNWGAALGAEVARGKVAGHQIERIADVTEGLDPFVALRNIARDMGDDIAKQAAAKAGLPWPLPAKVSQPSADTWH